MTPDALQGIGEVAGAIVMSVLAAVGGYKARGFGQPKKPAPVRITDATGVRHCPDHAEMMIATSKIPDIHRDLKTLSKKIDGMMDQAFSILRTHERRIGQLQGVAGMIETENSEESGI